MVTSLVYDSTLTRGPCLHNPGMFAPFLGLGFLGWKVSPLLHHLISLLNSFSLFVSKVRLGNLSRRKSGEFGLDCLLRHIASNRSRRLVLVLCCSTMAFGIERASCVWLAWARGRSLKSPVGASGD